MRRREGSPSPPASKPLVKRGVFPLKKPDACLGFSRLLCGQGTRDRVPLRKRNCGLSVWDWQSGRKEALYEADRGMEYGFLGDAVLTLPLIQTLADAFPGSEIDFYVRRGLASLFEAHPALHAVYEYDKRRIAGNNRLSALLKTGRILGGRRYDIWIGAHPSPRSALLARLSGAPVARGLYRGPRRGTLLQPARIPPLFRAARDRTAS